MHWISLLQEKDSSELRHLVRRWMIQSTWCLWWSELTDAIHDKNMNHKTSWFGHRTRNGKNQIRVLDSDGSSRFDGWQPTNSKDENWLLHDRSIRNNLWLYNVLKRTWFLYRLPIRSPSCGRFYDETDRTHRILRAQANHHGDEEDLSFRPWSSVNQHRFSF